VPLPREAFVKQELDALYQHINDIEIAMMTTRRADGHLQSRAMATPRPARGADLWFVTLDGTAKVRDLARDPHVNLGQRDGALAPRLSSARCIGLNRRLCRNDSLGGTGREPVLTEVIRCEL
jgi:hypothetical protein